MSNIFGYIFFGIFATAGIFCGYLACVEGQKNYYIHQRGVKTEGTVTFIVATSGPVGQKKPKKTESPIVIFKTQDGREQTYHCHFSFELNTYKVGDRVVMWYDPLDPERAIMETEGNELPWILVLFLFTHGGVGIGGIVYLERKRRLKIEHGKLD